MLFVLLEQLKEEYSIIDFISTVDNLNKYIQNM